RPSRAAASGICPASIPAHPPGQRRHYHLQAEEDRSGEGRLRSGRHSRSDLFQRSAAQGLRARRCRALSGHQCRPGAAVSGEKDRAATEVVGPVDVLAFWRAAGPDKWFEKDTAFDSEIAVRFFAVWHAAAAGKLEKWEDTPESALALTIVLDQFPR